MSVHNAGKHCTCVRWRPLPGGSPTPSHLHWRRTIKCCVETMSPWLMHEHTALYEDKCSSRCGRAANLIVELLMDYGSVESGCLECLQLLKFGEYHIFTACKFDYYLTNSQSSKLPDAIKICFFIASSLHYCCKLVPSRQDERRPESTWQCIQWCSEPGRWSHPMISWMHILLETCIQILQGKLHISIWTKSWIHLYLHGAWLSSYARRKSGLFAHARSFRFHSFGTLSLLQMIALSQPWSRHEYLQWIQARLE